MVAVRFVAILRIGCSYQFVVIILDRRVIFIFAYINVVVIVFVVVVVVITTPCGVIVVVSVVDY